MKQPEPCSFELRPLGVFKVNLEVLVKSDTFKKQIEASKKFGKSLRSDKEVVGGTTSG